MISVHFQDKPFNITVIQDYAPTSNTEEAKKKKKKKKRHPKRCPFHYRGWNAKVGSREMSGVTGKFGLGVQNEAGQRLIELSQENTLVIANTHFQQHKRRL